MIYLYESSDALNTPIECYYFDSVNEEFPVKPHWHYFIEIVLMLEGSAKMSNQGVDYYVHPGELMIFHPQDVHSIMSADGKPICMAVLKFDINCLNMSSNYSPKLRSIYHHAKKQEMPIHLTKDDLVGLQVENHFHRCNQEMTVQQYGFDLVIRSEIYELLVKILRFWQQKGFVIDSAVYSEDERFDIFNITAYIDEHMDESIRIPDVAKLCGMSYSYFAKKFMEVYGKSCKKYIEEMRIFKAEELLSFTDFDLTYIAQETGFSDCSHLIRSFTSHRNMTPKQYRTQARNGHV